MLKDPLSRNCWSSVNVSQRFPTLLWNIAFFTSVPSDKGPEEHLFTNRVTESSRWKYFAHNCTYLVQNYMCLARCALYRPSQVVLAKLLCALKIPPTSPKASFFSGSLAIWSHMSCGENWAKSSTTQELKSPHSRFRISPQTARPTLIAIWISLDHLNLSPAPYLITCGSPSLLAAASVASCFRFFPTSVAAGPS